MSHGGGSSSGAFLWSLTLTDFHSGWTELAALWGNSGGEVRVGLERIEKRTPQRLRVNGIKAIGTKNLLHFGKAEVVE